MSKLGRMTLALYRFWNVDSITIEYIDSEKTNTIGIADEYDSLYELRLYHQLDNIILNLT